MSNEHNKKRTDDELKHHFDTLTREINSRTKEQDEIAKELNKRFSKNLKEGKVEWLPKEIKFD